MKTLVGFLLGTVVGFGVGYVVCQDKFSKLADQEIESVKAQYRKKEREEKYENVKELDAPVEEDYEIEGGGDPVLFTKESLNDGRERTRDYSKIHHKTKNKEDEIMAEAAVANEELRKAEEEVEEIGNEYKLVDEDEFDSKYGELEHGMLLWYTNKGIIRDADHKEEEFGEDEAQILDVLAEVGEFPADDCLYMVNETGNIRYEVIVCEDPLED